ncbi:MAG: EAL domain-containing protein [Clostridia bacterium]|nr:EAL domain-containing protein [Clostridia bacterium]
MEKYQFSKAELAGMEASPVPFAVYQFINKRVVTLALSAGFCELFGFSDRQEAYGVMDSDMYRATHPEDVGRIAEAAVRFATEGGEYNVLYRSKDIEEKQTFVIHAQGRHVYTDTGVRLAYVWYTKMGVYSPDAGEKETLMNNSFIQALRESSMAYQNHYDSLTGLPNMTYFFELAAEGCKALSARGKTPALVFTDLCGMKQYNRKWGFSEGDRLIKTFGKTLTQYFSNENCARFGQDHFAVFADADGVEQQLESLFAACETMSEKGSLPVRAGIYKMEGEQIEIGLACDRAKMACNVNREARVSTFRYFDPEMLANAEKRQYVVDNLDRAIQEKWIQVYYQPIIRAANGRVCDEEALSRWIDPVKGFLSPADFIPYLEEAKLIYKLDLYVVDCILEKMKLQAADGLYVVPESVNLSRSDFDCCDIVEEIRKRVDAAGIERGKLTVEITESVVGSDLAFIKTQVERFHSLGFQVWMDDFGSGYSSLDVLQDICFDVIKLDMRFLQKFEKGDESRIILTEIVKMCIGLGVETVCEGVETKEQEEFLREIGCTKLQGFFYCKAVPLEEILNRYRTGRQIGFENPAESEYFAALGRINLYDLGAFSSENDNSLKRYFDTLPMAIMEVKGTWAQYARCNKTYRDFMKRAFGLDQFSKPLDYSLMPEGLGRPFMNTVMRCSNSGGRFILDEQINENTTIHVMVRRAAVNPVTGTSAVVVAVLAVMEHKEDDGATYSAIAQALSSDYLSLYYVDLDTEKFIQYSSDASLEELAMERHGKSFFAASQEDVGKLVYKADQEYVLQSFTKENIVNALDTQGTFTLTYRLMIDGKPTYVNMKAMRMQQDARHIIIGVSNVDMQTRQREALERVQAERATYARISALSDDYICIYTVDPKTNRFTVYSAITTYDGLGLPKEGKHFFSQARKDSARTIYPEDLDNFNAMFTKRNVMKEIKRSGLFVLRYRLLIDGEPKYVNVKAAMVEEKDGQQLIIGVNNIDEQVRHEQEMERRLMAARSRANLDTLTGVKNKTAYQDMSENLARQIEGGNPVKYAIALCSVYDLQKTIESKGEKEGDQRIRDACAIVCATFKHSPVFRVATDEFAVIAQGHDYENIDELVASLEENNRRNRKTGGVVIACGMAKYSGVDTVASVFDRADTLCRHWGK